MILLTRLNGPVFALNPDLVERADSTPDTVITLVDGTKTHLPVWMTEPEAAGEVALTDTPYVSVSALEAVRALLDQAWRSPKADGSA